ncbi:hypothetical protein H0X48_05880 [Candidatus Dependentiae bacterium]|nr:hypothetical protein [Candidatus Dependentiae bacterium]
MKNFALALLVAGSVAQVQAVGMTIQQGRERVAKVQAERDAVNQQVEQLDAKIQRLQDQVNNVNTSPDNAKKINEINRQLRDSVAQRKLLLEQHTKATNNFTQEIRTVGRKHHIDNTAGKYTVVDSRPANASQAQSARF